MVIFKETEYMYWVGDNKIIHAPKRQSMKKSKMRCVYKRNTIMFVFFFPGKKETALKHASKILKDKANWSNKCQLEKVNNQLEGCYVCTNCGECDFVMFPPIIASYRDIPSGRIRQYSYKRINHLKVRLRRFQAAEIENVPEKVYDIIKRDLRKRRIRSVEADGVFTTGSMPTLINIMEILKNNKLTKYYNTIQQIYCGVTGVAPLSLTREEEEMIIQMCKE